MINARYVDAGHTQIACEMAENGETIIITAIPGLSRYDQLIADGVAIAPFSQPVPEAVTNYQARAALLHAGLFDGVDAAVKASSDRTMVQAWEYANVYSRNSTFILSMAAALGLNSQQVDDLFIAAAQVV